MLAEVSRSAFRASFCAGSTDGGSSPNAKCGIKTVKDFSKKESFEAPQDFFSPTGNVGRSRKW